MNKIKETCELLGLDWIEEEKRSSCFNIAGSNAIFRFDNCGFLLCKVDDTGWYHSEYSNIISIICGSTAISPIKMAEPIKCFKNGDKYSYISGENEIYYKTYVNDMYDHMFMYFGNMFDADAVISDYQKKEILQRIKDGIPYNWDDDIDHSEEVIIIVSGEVVTGVTYFADGNFYGMLDECFSKDEVYFWMYEPKAPRHRIECLNCKINDTCQDAYDNVCGGVRPCLSCTNRHTSFSKEPCMSCGEHNNGCKWSWKDWSGNNV